MSIANYPSQSEAHRRADMLVHLAGLVFIVVSGSALIWNAALSLGYGLVIAVVIYALCALASNLASWAYHFSNWHERRVLLRRIDHAAIYSSITGTFTPLFVLASTTLTFTLLLVCWVFTVWAAWNKITNEQVKTKWSTASYLALGALGLCAVPDLSGVPAAALWCILAGAFSYVFGIIFYARKTMPYRYAIWHIFVTLGGAFMFAGIWLALF